MIRNERMCLSRSTFSLLRLLADIGAGSRPDLTIRNYVAMITSTAIFILTPFVSSPLIIIPVPVLVLVLVIVHLITVNFTVRRTASTHEFHKHSHKPILVILPPRPEYLASFS
jgi:hypothetical protein